MYSRFRTGIFGLILVALLTGCFFFVDPQGTVIPVDSKAPAFSLPDQSGQTVSLEGLLKKGSVMIVFYRGHW